MNPNKRHDGMTITIKATDASLDSGTTATGVYTHFAHKSLFGFRPTCGPWMNKEQVLSRDEWLIATQEDNMDTARWMVADTDTEMVMAYDVTEQEAEGLIQEYRKDGQDCYMELLDPVL